MRTLRNYNKLILVKNYCKMLCKRVAALGIVMVNLYSAIAVVEMLKCILQAYTRSSVVSANSSPYAYKTISVNK